MLESRPIKGCVRLLPLFRHPRSLGGEDVHHVRGRAGVRRPAHRDARRVPLLPRLHLSHRRRHDEPPQRPGKDFNYF